MQIKSIKSIKSLAGKRVLLRSDFNVPMKNGRVVEEYKIFRNLPTIQYLLKKRAKVLIVSHLGRPDGEVDLKYTLKPVAEHLNKMLKTKVEFIDDTCGLKAGTAAMKMKNGEILFLENVRFEAGEKKNEAKFAKKLASLADIYVNDAFAVSHRADASVSAIKRYLPSYAGLLLENEVKHLQAVANPKQPLVVIIGGVKLETKVPIINKFRKKAHRILLGGALANNFFAAHGYTVGKSLVDDASIKFAQDYIKKGYNKNLVLPVDVMVSNKKGYWDAHNVDANAVGKEDYIFDIGPKTIKLYKSLVEKSATVIWNGPMGMFEEQKFKHGTLSIARLLAKATDNKVFCVAGGGETVEALKLTKTENQIGWVSTGGGAMLDYLSGAKMPGLAGLVKK